MNIYAHVTPEKIKETGERFAKYVNFQKEVLRLINRLEIVSTIKKNILDDYINPIEKNRFKDLKEHFENKGQVKGVYFVFNEKEKLIYIGESSKTRTDESNWGLKDRINQHQAPGNSGAQSFGVPRETVRDKYFFSYTTSDDIKEIEMLERFLIGIFSSDLKFNKNSTLDIFS